MERPPPSLICGGILQLQCNLPYKVLRHIPIGGQGIIGAARTVPLALTIWMSLKKVAEQRQGPDLVLSPLATYAILHPFCLEAAGHVRLQGIAD